MLCALVLSGCTAAGGGAAAVAGAGAGTPADAPDGPGFVAGDGRAFLVPVGEREQAPDVRAPLLSGGEGDLEQLRGDEATVVNFWASWCAPCREEAPALQRVAAQTDAADVAFVGVNVRDSDGAASAFVRRLSERAGGQEPYPNLVDEGARVTAAFAGDYRSVPTTLVLDGEGRVAAKAYGPLTAADLSALLDAVRAA